MPALPGDPNQVLRGDGTFGTAAAAGSTGPTGAAGASGPTGPAGAGGGALAITEYAPTAQTIVTASVTSGSPWADIDASNLAISFTAPGSGKVIARLTAFADSSDDTGRYQWRLFDGSNQVGKFVTASRSIAGNINTGHVYITGLTGGNSYTLTWQHRQIGSGNGRVILHSGDGSTAVGFGPAHIIIETAP